MRHNETGFDEFMSRELILLVKICPFGFFMMRISKSKSKKFNINATGDLQGLFMSS